MSRFQHAKFIVSAAAPAAAQTGGGAPKCKTGKPCGNACIAMNKTCHKS